MNKDHKVEISVVDKDGKKRNDGKYSRDYVPDKRIFLQLMRIEPNGENVQAKEHHRPKGNIACENNRQKIQDKIGR